MYCSEKVRNIRKNTIIALDIIIIIGLLLNFFFVNVVPYIKVFHQHYQLTAWVLSFGKWSFIVFIILQVLQVILMFVPGEVIQATGGYIFGTFLGTILALCGIIIGSILAFFIGRQLGEQFLRRVLPKKQFKGVEALINKPKSKMVLLVLYLIPGLPKDILGYISGITSIRFKEFIFISTITRLPGVLLSTYMGANLFRHNYVILSMGIMFMSLLLIIGVSYKDKILRFIE